MVKVEKLSKKVFSLGGLLLAGEGCYVAISLPFIPHCHPAILQHLEAGFQLPIAESKMRLLP